jgi:hypothetical protein
VVETKGFAERLYYQGFTRVSEKRTLKKTTTPVERTLPCHLAWQIPFVFFYASRNTPNRGVFFVVETKGLEGQVAR